MLLIMMMYVFKIPLFLSLTIQMKLYSSSMTLIHRLFSFINQLRITGHRQDCKSTNLVMLMLTIDSIQACHTRLESLNSHLFAAIKQSTTGFTNPETEVPGF